MPSSSIGSDMSAWAICSVLRAPQQPWGGAGQAVAPSSTAKFKRRWGYRRHAAPTIEATAALVLFAAAPTAQPPELCGGAGVSGAELT